MPFGAGSRFQSNVYREIIQKNVWLIESAVLRYPINGNSGSKVHIKLKNISDIGQFKEKRGKLKTQKKKKIIGDSFILAVKLGH